MAQITIPKTRILINERPDDMTREEYREKRIEQKAYLNGYWEDKTDHMGRLVGKTYHMGRLDGILIPSYMYKNKNKPKIVIR